MTTSTYRTALAILLTILLVTTAYAYWTPRQQLTHRDSALFEEIAFCDEVVEALHTTQLFAYSECSCRLIDDDMAVMDCYPI